MNSACLEVNMVKLCERGEICTTNEKKDRGEREKED